MTINIKSLHGRLINLAHEKKIDFQALLNRLGAEQFLFRLSRSSYADQFIFKGGSLLTYLIDTDRKTKDLDFSIRQISNQVDDAVQIIQSILSIPVDDALVWREVKGEVLNHPDMEYPGVRLACPFLLGNMRGLTHLDLAIGDAVEGVHLPLKRMRYRDTPIFGEDFFILAYPLETVFAEKLQTALQKQGQNTRMKDYFDLFKLIDHPLRPAELKQSIQATFKNRGTPLTTKIEFEEQALERLQTYWEHFLKREKMSGVPGNIREAIEKVNHYLKELYD